MNYDAIFSAYYQQYRADSDVPTSADDEYTVGLSLANEAINRWENYDGNYWRELFETHQANGTGTQTVTTGTTSYTAPTNFKEAGGFIKVVTASGGLKKAYPIINVEQVQSQNDSAVYCYFKGNPKDGYTFNLNPAPTAELNGLDIDFTYYKKPTLFTIGTDVTELADPYFIVHRMLASQFRAARNPYYSSAKADSENALKQMKMDNDSGTWTNPWAVADRSGSVFGGASGGSFFGNR